MLTLIRRLRGERGGVALIAVVALFFLLVFAFAVCDTDTARASHREVCVTVLDEPAYTEVIPAVTEERPIQRYSYTGGPQGLDETGTPKTLPPGDDWQANTTTYNDGTSHGGNLGLYDVSRGGSGNADWFYWEVGTVVVTPEQVIEHPAVTHEKCRPVLHSPEPPQKPEEPKGDVDGPKNAKPLPKDLAFTGPMAAETAAIAAGALIALGLASLWLSRRRNT